MHHPDMKEDETHVRAYYQTGVERARLDSALGVVEFERTKEIIGRHVPTPPATVADIGGGPERHVPELLGMGPHLLITARRQD